MLHRPAFLGSLVRGRARPNAGTFRSGVGTVATVAAVVAIASLSVVVVPGASGFPLRHAEESTAGEVRNVAEAIFRLQGEVGAKVPRVDRLPRESDFFYQCARLPGLPDTRLCLFNSRLLMNAALARPSYFSENERRVLSQSEYLEEVKGSRAEGFNLGVPTLVEFLRRKAAGEGGPAGSSAGMAGGAASSAASGGASSTASGEGVSSGNEGTDGLLPGEQVFLRVEEKFQAETLQPLAAHGEPAYLITASVTEDLVPVLTHELQHAQFFHDEAFRRAVALYWKNAVNEDDRAAFRKALEGSYDVRDERVMLDEFQAYVLMTSSTLEALEPLARKHGAPLRAALRAERLEPWAGVVPDTSR